MLVLETVAKIRRVYIVQEKTIKAICRETRKICDPKRPSFITNVANAAAADRPMAGRTRGPDTEVRFTRASPEHYMNALSDAPIAHTGRSLSHPFLILN